MDRVNALIVVVLALLLVAAAKWPRILRALRFPKSSSWPTVPAIVEQALVHTYSGRGGNWYRAEIVYSYEVNGDYYAGRYMGDSSSSEAEVDQLVQQYPKGVPLQVHVNPQKPESSFWI